MKQVYYGEFRKVVVTQIREIEASGPDYQSTAWYVLRYFRRVAFHAGDPASPHDMESSMRSLLRFYVDRVDRDSELGERCLRVIEAHRRSQS